MKKLIAKSIVGKEYMHSRSQAYLADKEEADKICAALNRAEYQLKEGECWHVYDYAPSYVDQIISLTKTGRIKLSYI